jgi:hypothetical protein
MPPARPPGRCHRGSGIDRALPTRARVAAPRAPGDPAAAPTAAGGAPAPPLAPPLPPPPPGAGGTHALMHACALPPAPITAARRLRHPLARASPPARADRQHNRHPRLPEHQQPRLHRPLSHPPAPPVSAPRRSRRSQCSLPWRRHCQRILARPRITATARTRITATNV